MPGLQVLWPKRCKIKPLQLAKDLDDCDPARTRRSHAADCVAAICAANSLALDRLIIGNVARCQRACPVRLGSDFVCYALRNRSAVKGFRAAIGQRFQCFSKRRIADQRPGWLRLSIIAKIDAAGLLNQAGAFGKARKEASCTIVQFEAIASERNGWRKQIGPSEFAVSLMRFCCQCQIARHANA